MTDQNQARNARENTRSNAPWMVAAVLALLVAALVVVLVRTYSVRDDNKRNAGRLIAPTAPSSEAVQTGATEAANLTTLSRENYKRDFARALAGATGKLRKDLVSHKAAYLSAMTSGKFDLKATRRRVRVRERGQRQGARSWSRSTARTSSTAVANPVATPQRLELTMVPSGGTWLATDFNAVGIQ